jgi:hypothetical protein
VKTTNGIHNVKGIKGFEHKYIVLHPCHMVWWLILVASNNLLLHKDHKSLVPQNHEQKLTLPSIDEHLVSDNGVLMFIS